MATVRIPARRDGSGLDAQGNAVTHLSCLSVGTIQNGAESTIIQTTTDARILAVPYWSDDGLTMDARSYAEMLTWISYVDGLWIKWRKINGVCHVYKIIQYPAGLDLTLDEYNKNVQWVGGLDCGAGIAELFTNYVSEGGDNYISEGGDNYTGE